MILKKLVEEYDYDIISFIFKHYKKLNITYEQASVLMHLFYLIRSKKAISVVNIAKGLPYTKIEIEKILDELITNELLVSTLETTKTGKQREVYNMDLFYNHVEKTLEKNNDDNAETITEISQSVELLEKKLNRMLTPNELSIVRVWFSNDKVSYKQLVEIINKMKQSISIKAIDNYLHTEKDQPLKKNPKVEKAIDALFNQLK